MDLSTDRSVLPIKQGLLGEIWQPAVAETSGGRLVLNEREKSAAELLNLTFLKSRSEEFSALEFQNLGREKAVCSTYSTVSADPLEKSGQHIRAYLCDTPGVMVLKKYGSCITIHKVLGLAVHPSYRRCGLGSALMKTRLQQAKEAGAVLSVLTASEPTIYRRFGYALMNYASEIEATFGEAGLQFLPEVAEAASKGSCIRADISKLENVIESLEEKILGGESPISAGAIAYSPSIKEGLTGSFNPWDENAKGSEQQYAIVHRGAQGDIDGLMVYQIRRSQAGKSFARVYACLYLNIPALVAMWSELSSTDLLTKATSSLGHLQNLLPELLVDRSKVTLAKQQDMFWGRILDIPGFLKNLPWQGSAEIALTVEDELGLTDGKYQLSVVDGEPHIVGTEKISENTPGVSLNVADLLRISRGMISAQQLVATGLAQEQNSGGALFDSVIKVEQWHPGYWF